MSILTAELAKRNATTYMELDKYHVDADDEDVTNRFQSMCTIMSSDSYRYSGICNNLKNSTLMGIDNYPKTKTTKYGVLVRYKKTTPPC